MTVTDCAQIGVAAAMNASAVAVAQNPRIIVQCTTSMLFGLVAAQLPGSPCASAKNTSFQLDGLVLITPVLNICSAYWSVPFGAVVKIKPGMFNIASSSSSANFSLVALR